MVGTCDHSGTYEPPVALTGARVPPDKLNAKTGLPLVDILMCSIFRLLFFAFFEAFSIDIQRFIIISLTFSECWLVGPLQLSFAPAGSNLQLRHCEPPGFLENCTDVQI